MRFTGILYVALTLLPLAAGRRVKPSSDTAVLEAEEDSLQTKDALDDFLDGVSSPKGPEDRPPDAPIGNPILTQGTETERAARQGQEGILRLEEVSESMAEDYEEEKVEEICVQTQHKREESDYESEQSEVKSELSKPKDGHATEPFHECDRIWGTHKSIYPVYFRPWGTPWRRHGAAEVSAKRPMFPERLGEFVIQEVRHLEPQPGKHLLLTLRGCTSCVNEITTTVEWGGLTLMNENGEYHKVTSVNPIAAIQKAMAHSEQIVMKRKSYDCMTMPDSCRNNQDYHTWEDATYFASKVGNPRNYSRETVSSKSVKRATYQFTSYKGDTVIEPLLEETRTATGPERRAKLKLIGTELRHDEKHVPFNHELEQLHIELRVCTSSGQDGPLVCEEGSTEELVVHDGAVLSGSTKMTMLDTLGSQDTCSYGACTAGTFMTECIPGSCRSPARFARANRQSNLCYASLVEGLVNNKSGAPPRGGHFSCITERAHGMDTPIVHGDMGTNGLFFRTGTASKAHVTGHMQWHVTVPSPGTCMPELGDALYIGMGVSEADPCLPQGPDLDLGVVFYRCGSAPEGMKVQSSSQCEVVNYRTYGDWHKQGGRYGASGGDAWKIKEWAQYSGDNQDGEGGGDDEWFFIRLDAARQLGVTHIAITTHIYGCEKSPNTDVSFSQLEGAFMRFASGPVDKDNLQGVETFAYLDVDVSMAKTRQKGAIMAVLFLENSAEHPLPVEHREEVERGRKDEAHKHNTGERWQIAFLADPIRSTEGYTLHRSFGQVGHQVFGNREISDSQRIEQTDGLTQLHTGHEEKTGSAGKIIHALEAQQVEAFESEAHSSDSSDSSAAKHMTSSQFYQDYSYTFASGHPGTALYCFAPK